VAPSSIPEIKNVIRHTTLEQCKAIAAKALSMENAREIKSYLNEELKKRAPGVEQ
jgi:phosphoenolpyruvate-protein kinase (PTS system EI component)